MGKVKQNLSVIFTINNLHFFRLCRSHLKHHYDDGDDDGVADNGSDGHNDED